MAVYGMIADPVAFPMSHRPLQDHRADSRRAGRVRTTSLKRLSYSSLAIPLHSHGPAVLWRTTLFLVQARGRDYYANCDDASAWPPR
jgi:hypothetical protein